MGIIAMIIAFKKGRKGYGIFLAIWNVVAIITFIATKGAFAFGPGWVFLVIALCMHKNYDTNDKSIWILCNDCGKHYSKTLTACPYCALDKKETAEPAPKKIEIQEKTVVSAEPVSEGYVRCPSCGKVQIDDRTICFECGAKFANSANEKVTPAARPVQTAACKSCGYPLDDDDSFCCHCGAKVE